MCRTRSGAVTFFDEPLGAGEVASLLSMLQGGGKLPAEQMCNLLHRQTVLLKRLPNVQRVALQVDQRLTVVGDIHGQLADLLHIFAINGPPSAKSLYVFNGDFVDRGPCSVEVRASSSPRRQHMPTRPTRPRVQSVHRFRCAPSSSRGSRRCRARCSSTAATTRTRRSTRCTASSTRSSPSMTRRRTTSLTTASSTCPSRRSSTRRRSSCTRASMTRRRALARKRVRARARAHAHARVRVQVTLKELDNCPRQLFTMKVAEPKKLLPRMRAVQAAVKLDREESTGERRTAHTTLRSNTIIHNT